METSKVSLHSTFAAPPPQPSVAAQPLASAAPGRCETSFRSTTAIGLRSSITSCDLAEHLALDSGPHGVSTPLFGGEVVLNLNVLSKQTTWTLQGVPFGSF